MPANTAIIPIKAVRLGDQATGDVRGIGELESGDKISPYYLNLTDVSLSGNTAFDTSTLFVDGTNNRVGINSSSPQKNLQINDSTSPTIRFSRDTSYYWEIGHTSSDFQLNSQTGGTIMHLNYDGNVGIGTSSPSTQLHVKDDTTTLTISDTGSNLTLNDEQVAIHLSGRYYTGTADPDADEYSDARIVLRRGNTDGTGGAVLAFENSGNGSAGLLERMRIDSSGKILFGTSSFTAGTDGYQISGNGRLKESSTDATTTKVHNAFYNPNGQVGTITTSSSATSYNTSSDYRLKENVVEVTDGIDRVKLLKPSRFNFIVDPDKTVDGFLAHEVSDIVPEAITGTKDAVDDEGNPEYQGIDQSKLVPLLTAALQESIAKIEALETRVATLENN